ncbi:MAG TPA: prephenate dehydrogenase/arogenate dehydrogenase family protein [Candidatus Sulfotelmatobacter sp.]|nr:prephenate dehydrogenase/arogenate dehydrogenase family protein [Candidatus Sulfotelmatobacter sp.]
MPEPLRPVAILGLGLIGGSVARALSRRGGWRVSAWSRTAEATARALEEGTIQATLGDPAEAATAPLVLLATPVPAILELIRSLGPGLVASGAVVTDVGSSKAVIMATAAAVPGLRFVGGHPMSGAETRGYAASSAALFEGRPWVVVPGTTGDADAVQAVEQLALGCGARPVTLDAAAHDGAVAAISHLPLVASLALAQAALDESDWPLARRLAAQGWRDMTRLARGDPAMGGGLLATNAPAVGARLRAYRTVLEAWQVRLDALAASAGDGPAEQAALADLIGDLGRLAASLGDPGPA